jgi:hypothetical protein
VINDIYIFNDTIAITKKKFNINLLNTVILDLKSLNDITKTSEDKANGNPGFIVPYHNYYLQYFSLVNYIYVYKDSFTSTPSTISYPFVKSIQYNPFKDVFYVVAKDKLYSLDTISSLIPTFNCSRVEGAIFNASSPYSPSCTCPSGQLFNR